MLALMTSYNRVNGRHPADDQRLLGDVVRREWGFEGIVMTDWFGLTTTVDAAHAGLDLEMPGPARSFGPALAEAVRAGSVAETLLDAKVRHLLSVFDRIGALDDGAEQPERPVDRPEDRALTRRAAAEAAVLLSNRGVLPLEPSSLHRLAVVGPNADRAAIMGGGSAGVVPHYLVSPLAVLRERFGQTHEILHEPADDEAGIERAAKLARAADAAIVIVGTDSTWEREDYDRATMDLPGHQDDLVRRVVEANPRSVVVVNAGSPVTMPWAGEAGALLQTWFAGQEYANGLVDILFGDADPGGRLPTTLPLAVEHAPAFANFPGESSEVRYGEGLLVGYRWYEARKLPVRFPFGHGLSYTSFEIGPPRLSAARLDAGGRLRVEVRVTNTGQRPGAEVVQLYVLPPDGGRPRAAGRLRPVKELKAFAKVRLDPGEATTLGFDLGERSFAYYDVADRAWPELQKRRPMSWASEEPHLHREQAGWYVDPGTYGLALGRSSAEIAHTVTIEVAGGADPLDPSTPLD